MNDFTGQRFGKVIVLFRTKSLNHHSRWHCKCDCGNEIDINSDKLKAGRTKSCGCLKIEFFKNGGPNKTHGMTKTRLYRIWSGMITRCNNPNQEKRKKDYQDRGITVCKEWYSFKTFRDWAISSGYNDKLTIERKNNDIGYSPENCTWANAKTQANNRTICRYYNYNGETLTIAQWADRFSIKYHTLYQRLIKLGWSIDNALNLSVERRIA